MEKIYKPLSGTEIIKWIPNVNLMRYSDFKKYKKLPRLPIVVLYEVKPDFGHWVLIHKTPEGIEHFDSYGYLPDDEFSFIPENFRPDNKYLLHLLSKRDDVNYNQYKFQEDGSIATCGRWVILRYLFNNLTIDKFTNMINKTIKQLNVTPDELVTQVI